MRGLHLQHYHGVLEHGDRVPHQRLLLSTHTHRHRTPLFAARTVSTAGLVAGETTDAALAALATPGAPLLSVRNEFAALQVNGSPLANPEM